MKSNTALPATIWLRGIALRGRIGDATLYPSIHILSSSSSLSHGSVDRLLSGPLVGVSRPARLLVKIRRKIFRKGVDT